MIEDRNARGSRGAGGELRERGAIEGGRGGWGEREWGFPFSFLGGGLVLAARRETEQRRNGKGGTRR